MTYNKEKILYVLNEWFEEELPRYTDVFMATDGVF